MIPLISLWLPILLAAVIVFLASFIIHMLLPYHRTDFRKLPSEDDVRESLNKFNIPTGDYVIPYAGSPEVMKSPEYIEKTTKGPVVLMTVMKNGPPSMGASLIQWFIYCVIVGFFAAYLTSRTLGADAQYLTVFQISGCSAFLGYALALLQNSIWYKRSWSGTLKTIFDGFVYALLTGGTFGWLWPAA